MTQNREESKVFLNTWGAYNSGSIGYGWMTPAEAREFMESDPERDGGEWFIADIDNYLGVVFGSLECCNVEEVIDDIEQLENMDDYERDCVIALMDVNSMDIADAIEDLDGHTFYESEDEFFDSMDELIECELCSASDLVSRYFDYDAYHRDCLFDVAVADNGIVVW